MKPSIQERLVRSLPDRQLVNAAISLYLNIYFSLADRIKVWCARKSFKYAASYNKNPSVLVYIPSFNRIGYLLERSIPSILRQTYQNYKICVVDDGSNDDTTEILKNMYGDSILILQNERKYYRYPNLSMYHWLAGPVDAANLALKELGPRFDWIARIDDDDEWLPDHLSTAIDYLLKTGAEFYSSDYITLNKNGTINKRISKDLVTGIGGTQTWLYHSGFTSIRYNMNCWRKKTNRVNDKDLEHRLFRAGLTICHLNHDGCIIKPRNDESVIGSQAYLQSPDKYERFYNSNS